MQSDEMWLCGDVHGDLRTLRRALWDRSPPKAIVLVGDLDPPELVGPWLEAAIGHHVDTWFIHGNHETDSVIPRLGVVPCRSLPRKLAWRMRSTQRNGNR